MTHDHAWVKVSAWIGVLAVLVGMTVIGLDVVCGAAPSPDPGPVSGFPGGDPFPGAPIPVDAGLDVAAGSPARAAWSSDAGLGLGLFFGGFALAAVAGLGHARSRRHRVTGRVPARTPRPRGRGRRAP